MATAKTCGGTRSTWIEEADAEELDGDDRQIGEHDHDVDAVDYVRLLNEEHRPGGNAVDEEAAENDGRGGVAGDAEAQQRDHGAAGHSIVGGLRGHDSGELTLAEALRLIGEAPRLVVGEEGGDRPPRAGDGADAGADEGRAQEVAGCRASAARTAAPCARPLA